MNYETPDLATAAYLLMRGYKLLQAQKSAGRYQFIFEDPNSDAAASCIEFINSECSRFDSCLRNLRSMVRERN